MIVLWDSKGIVFIEFLHGHRTIHAIYYCEVLRKSKAAIAEKDGEFQSTIFYYFMTMRTAALATNSLKHPPYSLDLSPYDSFVQATEGGIKNRIDRKF